jgi:guanosine-3',5'-bis(diphosphate) 3'-pyrophosphohydrolase
MFEEAAREFAYEKHEGQLRKDGLTPYIEHPKAVVQILEDLGISDDDVLSAAWLHDIVEDCGVELAEIREKFNDRIAGIVRILTRDIDRDEYKKRLLESPREAQLLKLADMVHNCRTLQFLDAKGLRRKVTEGREFYIPLARRIAPALVAELERNIEEYGGIEGAGESE